MSTATDIVNTFDQLRAAFAAGFAHPFAIVPFHVGHRTPYFGGWEIMHPVGRDGSRANVSVLAQSKRTRFSVLNHHVEPRQRKSAALLAAQSWVRSKHGYAGAWQRNAMGDYVPAEIAKAHPLRGATARVFWASAVHVPVPRKHRANNGCNQVYVLVRCRSRARLAEILRTTVGQLARYNLVHEVCADWRPELAAIAKRPETIYYNPDGMTVSGYLNQWFELKA